jgi:hypothetical protein
MHNCYCSNLDFVAQLPHLQQLHLVCTSRPPRVSVEPLCACTHLTSLSLTRTLAPSTVLLQQLTQLRTLDLSGCIDLQSLAFLKGCALLTSLSIKYIRPPLPVAELQHLTHLRTLESLSLHDLMDRVPTSMQLAPFQRPLPHFPALRKVDLTYCFRDQ